MREDELRKGLKASLSGVTFDRERQRAVLAEMRSARPARLSMRLAVALVMALALLGGTAVAAGLGLFGRLAEIREKPETNLHRLERLAQTYDERRVIRAEDGEEIIFTLRQAYCDGVQLFFSYELSRQGQMGDGGWLTDGTPLDIHEGYVEPLEDGGEFGYQVLWLPEDIELDETLDVLLSVDGQRLPLTIQVCANVVALTGQADFGTYAATAQLRRTDIALKGTVLLDCPEAWKAFWMENGSGESSVDRIDSYTLMDGETRLPNRSGGFGVTEEGMLEILVQFDAPSSEILRLIPEYAVSGECPEEAILLTVRE